MRYNSIKYSLKVWLTSVALAPFLSIVILAFIQGMKFSDLPESLHTGLDIYFAFTVFGFVFSIGTWLTFLLFIKITTLNIRNLICRRWTIFIAGISLTTATFIIFFWGDIFQGHSIFFVLMLCHCACIGWGTWFYKLKPVTPEDEPAVVENN